MVKKSSGKILVVEDERNLGQTLVECLEREGYEAAWARSKAEAEAEISSRRFDLALLDVGLPDGSGFDVAAGLRKMQPGASIVFLTAMGAPEQRVHGLELGAEDYIVKPFHLKELLLRIHNVMRRALTLGAAQDGVKLGRAVINFSRYEAVVEGEATPLTQKETALLKLLVDRRGHVVSRDEILNFVWSEDEFPSSRTIDNFILRLRRLIERKPDEPELIRSVRGVGYQLAPEEK